VFLGGVSRCGAAAKRGDKGEGSPQPADLALLLTTQDEKYSLIQWKIAFNAKLHSLAFGRHAARCRCPLRAHIHPQIPSHKKEDCKEWKIVLDLND
jgi:hypothetical protein